MNANQFDNILRIIWGNVLMCFKMSKPQCKGNCFYRGKREIVIIANVEKQVLTYSPTINSYKMVLLWIDSEELWSLKIKEHILG